MVMGTKLMFSTVQVGQKVDVVDTEYVRSVPICGIWTEAVVVSKNSTGVVVHYLCWDQSFDEEIPRAQFSQRVRPYGSKAFVEGGVIRRHNRLDVLDVHPSRNKWCTGFVVRVDERRVLIHYKGYQKKFDEWIGRFSHRLAPYGRKQHAQHPDLSEVSNLIASKKVKIPQWGPAAPDAKPARVRRNSNSALDDSAGGAAKSVQSGPEVDEEADAHADYVRKQQVYTASLWKKYSLRAKKQEPDGNCLFRSVSDQIYGDPRYHTIVREYTVDYMQVQRNSFQPFVAPSMRDFEIYLRLMRCNGTNYKAVWGGEPELQAMSELYQRPFIVYSAREDTGEAYIHAEYGSGFKNKRGVTPVKLNFYQYGHYDSAVPIDSSESSMDGGTPSPQPGQIELAMLKLLKTAASSTLTATTESQQLLAAIAASRQLWHKTSALNMEKALNQSVEFEDQRAVQMALEASTKQSSTAGTGNTGIGVSQKRPRQSTESKEDTAEMDLVLAAVNQSLAEKEHEEEKALKQALTLSKQQAAEKDSIKETEATLLDTTLKKSAKDAESAILKSTLEASEHDAKIEQLMAMMPHSGTPPEYLRTQAQFFLESANWDVEVAVSNLFSTF